MKTYQEFVKQSLDEEISSFQKAVNSTQIGYDEMPDEVKKELDDLLELQRFYMAGDYDPSYRTVRDFKRVVKKILKITSEYGQKVVGTDMIQGSDSGQESDAWK